MANILAENYYWADLHKPFNLMVTLEFSSIVRESPSHCWDMVTSVGHIHDEMSPLLKMTFPSAMSSLNSRDIKLGSPIGHCWLLLFGVLPIDYSKLTFVEFESGRRFVEQSTMGSMRSWRHERTIEAVNGGTRISDHLAFEPRLPATIIMPLVAFFFRHRHRSLQRKLGGVL